MTHGPAAPGAPGAGPDETPRPLPRAAIRTTPQDFVVEEVPAYAPSGAGEHLFVTFRKTGRTTLDAVRDLARALETDPRAAGYAGMKDRHAVTTQTASFAFPIARGAPPSPESLSLPGIEVLEVARHEHKLKPGHLRGNRFTLVLRGLAPERAGEVAGRLVAAGRDGVPNTFGPQRFGRDGDNPARALEWIAGKSRGPRDPRERRLLFSALQAKLFNDVLERRVAAGTWSTVLPGDLAKKHDTGGLFVVPAEGPELEDARARAAAAALSATGPMYGAKMRWPEGAPRALEEEVLAASGLAPGHLAAARSIGEGTRRALRLEVAEMRVAEVAGTPAQGAALRASFLLPKGGFATTVLARACLVVDASRGGPPPARDGAAAGDGDDDADFLLDD